MTLFEDIGQVYDGVSKAPPLEIYNNSKGLNGAHSLLYAELWRTSPRSDKVYKHANALALEAVRIMQLASANIEKEQSEKFKSELVEHFNQNAVNHPIAVFTIKDKKPVFAYVNREMSGLNDAEDVRKALAADAPGGYCEEVRRFMIEYSELNDLQMPPVMKDDPMRRTK